MPVRHARRPQPPGTLAARRRFAHAAPWLALLLAACSPADQDTVVARVNGTTIDAREVELALQREGARGGAQEDAKAARRHLLHTLVIEELMAQQFRRTVPGSAEVDRSAIAAARRDVLARHFAAALAARTPPPSCDEIRAYYVDNPPLFAHRRLFELRQLDLALPPAREAELRAHLAAAASLDELMAWLRSADLRFVMSQTERGSDELPTDLRTRLQAMEAGQVAVLPAPQGFQVVQLVGSRAAPLNEDGAWPLIARHLWLERQAATLDAEIRKLSRMAAVSFPGDPSSARAAVVASALDLGGRPEAVPSCAAAPVKTALRGPKDPREGTSR